MVNYTKFCSFQQDNLPSSNNMSKAARNVIKTMLTVSIVFVLCWLANVTYFILYTAGADIKLSGTAYLHLQYMAYLVMQL